MVDDDYGKDAKDQFIHAILDGHGGNCASMPVFFVAIGRRLGFPLYIVKTIKHLFMRWDDPLGTWILNGSSVRRPGEVFNIEATGSEIYLWPDEVYRDHWPYPISDEDLETGIFLKSLTPEEELAEFLAWRAWCFEDNGRFAEGHAALKWSVRLAPHNPFRKKIFDQLTEYFETSKRVVDFFQSNVRLVRQSIQRAVAEPAVSTGPRWVQVNGTRALIQILKPSYLSPNGQAAGQHANVGMSLQSHSVQLPSGDNAWAEVPTHCAHRPMATFWIKLSMNEFVLVHKPLQGAHVPDSSNLGKPVLPERQQSTHWGTPHPMNGGHAATIRPQEEQRLSWSEESALKQAAETMKLEAIESSAPPRSPLPASLAAMGLAPAIEFVPSHDYLPPIPRQHSVLLPF